MNISFVTIPVCSMEESTAFYTSHLDFSVERSFSPADNLRITFLTGGSGCKLELIERSGAFQEENSMISIGFEVENIQEVYERFRAASVEVPEEPHSMPNGVTLMQARDPNGVRLGFVQYNR